MNIETEHGTKRETGAVLKLCGGTVVTPDGLLEHGVVNISGPTIDSIGSADAGASPAARSIDCRGLYILPGMIDIHADYIEHMASPRPTAVLDTDLALAESERELISHGITTMYHSLSIYKRDEFINNPIRTPKNLSRFIQSIRRSHMGQRMIHHRFHARLEIDCLDRLDEIRGYVEQGDIHLLSFMDHTPGQGQYRDLEMFRKTVKGYRDLDDGQVDDIISHHQNKEKMVFEDMKQMAQLAKSRGISIASHDDDSIDKIDVAMELGSSISEFPITLEVARRAREKGLHCVAGAPNVLLGGSHSGNLSAAEAVLDGAVDILCSDYYPAAMLHAVFALHRQHALPLHRLSELVSANPARAVGIYDQRGSLEVGKMADIIAVELMEVEDQDGHVKHFPAVRFALVDGVEVYRSAYRSRSGGAQGEH